MKLLRADFWEKQARQFLLLCLKHGGWTGVPIYERRAFQFDPMIRWKDSVHEVMARHT